MAYIFGNPQARPLRQDIISLGILMCVPLISATLVYDASEGRWAGIFTSGMVGLGLAGLMIFSYLKLYPGSLQRVFKPQLFAKRAMQDRSVVDELIKLQDDWFVFNDIILELFAVEHLVIGSGGVFVLAKVRHAGPLAPRDGILFAGDEPLEVLCSRIWRTSHLVNILLKKWFKVDHLPQPILVAEQKYIGHCHEFDGIQIVDFQDVARRISQSPEAMDGNTVVALAKFVRERYAPGK